MCCIVDFEKDIEDLARASQSSNQTIIMICKECDNALILFLQPPRNFPRLMFLQEDSFTLFHALIEFHAQFPILLPSSTYKLAFVTKQVSWVTEHTSMTCRPILARTSAELEPPDPPLPLPPCQRPCVVERTCIHHLGMQVEESEG